MNIKFNEAGKDYNDGDLYRYISNHSRLGRKPNTFEKGWYIINDSSLLNPLEVFELRQLGVTIEGHTCYLYSDISLDNVNVPVEFPDGYSNDLGRQLTWSEWSNHIVSNVTERLYKLTSNINATDSVVLEWALNNGIVYDNRQAKICEGFWLGEERVSFEEIDINPMPLFRDLSEAREYMTSMVTRIGWNNLLDNEKFIAAKWRAINVIYVSMTITSKVERETTGKILRLGLQDARAGRFDKVIDYIGAGDIPINVALQVVEDSRANNFADSYVKSGVLGSTEDTIYPSNMVDPTSPLIKDPEGVLDYLQGLGTYSITGLKPQLIAAGKTEIEANALIEPASNLIKYGQVNIPFWI